MNIFLSVLILILIFGAMVTVHEAGHFFAAKWFRMDVREFAIGMGPALYKRKRREDEHGHPVGAAFSLRVFPVGGFCDLGEDNESDDPRHFRNHPLWQRCAVLFAGAAMNLLLGLLLAVVLCLSLVGHSVFNTEITGFADGFPYADQIQAGDVIVKVNGHAVYSYRNLDLFLQRGAGSPYELTLRRGQERITVSGIERTVEVEDGRRIIGLYFEGGDDVTFPYALKMAWFIAVDYVRLVQLSLGDLITGRAAPTEMMGPVGVGGVVSQTLEQSRSAGDALFSLINLAALLSINLAVFNLLPVPALDGGRILLAVISFGLIRIRKRPLSARIEGSLHGVMFILLIGLMVFVFFNDIRRLSGL
ncbi:MAG: site-2 protease family protein [Oscillospiraceae bacterium]|nr:site-2 protease family protein [Oscillospiraceae bacterium]